MASTPTSAPPPTSAPSPPAPATPPTTTPSAPLPSTHAAPPPTTPALSSPPASPSTPSPPPATPSSPPDSPATPVPPSTTTGTPPATPSAPSPPAPVTPGVPSTVPVTPAAPSRPSPATPVVPSPPSSSSSGGSPAGSGGSPPSSTRGSPPAQSSDSSSSVSTSLVVGVAVGGVILLVLLTLCCVCCYKKKKRRDTPSGMYYGAPPPKDGNYGGQPQSWQHNATPPADHAVNIPHNLSPPPAYASRPPMFPTPPPPPPQPGITSSGGSGSNYSGSQNPLPPPSPGLSLGFHKSIFTFEELMMATDGFSDANLLGQGGFGYVHRGMLPSGKEVAIKQLKAGSGQGEREFQAEVEIISRVHHKHLVSLVGYCITGDRRLLVYEFVPNNTLEFHLHGRGRPTMEWSTRLKIAVGSAKGLAYLHEDCHPKIIHRDIKAANILIDFNFEAKVADFGLAKLATDNNTHVSTRVMGTFGYLAPEYASSGKLTEKSDVFSYGVMLLELITGRKPVDTNITFMDDSLVDWARPLLTRSLEEGNHDMLADPRLQQYNPNEMAQMVTCAAACIRHSARRRPRMSQIMRALEGDVSLDDLNDGTRPGHSTLFGSLGSSDYDSNQYNEDMKKFRKLALTTHEYASSEYSAVTSEYGQNPSGSSSEAQTREMELAKMKYNGSGLQ